jgi:hypothetical protein
MQGVDPSIQLSAQALVDCVPNPQHCGGKGGCDGATSELAYSFMRDHGIPLESELEYEAVTGACPVSLDGLWPAKSRVRVSGWNQLPSNRAEPLQQALVSEGPTVVAVDANNWLDYNSGIFDDCDKDAILGHAVLAIGYGQEGGTKYWHIQNSWGDDWGENGNIRIVQHDDESSWCGTDNKPQEGLGCDGGPPSITVCGTCGILFDPIVPQGVRLEGPAASSPATTKAELPKLRASVPKAEIVAPPEETNMEKLLHDSSEAEVVSASASSSSVSSESAPVQSHAVDSATAPLEARADDSSNSVPSKASMTPSASSMLSTDADVDEERMKALLDQAMN